MLGWTSHRGNHADVDVSVAYRGWPTGMWLPLGRAADQAVRRVVLDRGWGGRTRFGVSVVLDGDSRVRALNRHWRARRSATNVLSFPLYDPADLRRRVCDDGTFPADAWDDGTVFLGDVVLARGVVGREAREMGVEMVSHAVRLVVHGVIHLMGYDHPTFRDENMMKRLERIALVCQRRAVRLPL